MHCPEVRETISRFIDGKVDSATRKAVGLHLIECEECSRLIEDGRFWDQALLAHLDRHAPTDLRERILADTVGADAARSASSGVAPGGRISRRNQLRIIRWAATRGSSPRTWLEVAAVAALVMLWVRFSPILFSGRDPEPFTSQGPVTVLAAGDFLEPGTEMTTSSLSFDGRLF